MTLLDVNALTALCDEDHVHHRPVRPWFLDRIHSGWATCPLTENGLLRLMGHPAYAGGPGSPEPVRPLLVHLRSLPGHQFWDDSVSATDTRLIPSKESRQGS